MILVWTPNSCVRCVQVRYLANYLIFKNCTKFKKITVKKFIFQNFDTGLILIGVLRVYSWSFIAKHSYSYVRCVQVRWSWSFTIRQFSKNSKIQKITVKKIFFRNFDKGFLLIGVFRVYIRSFIAKLAETKISIFFKCNPSIYGKNYIIYNLLLKC